MRRKPRRRTGPEALVHPQWHDTWEAIEALRKAENPEPHQLLKFLEDPRPMARAAAADAIGEVGKQAEAEVLLRHLNDPNQLVRNEIVEALAKMRYRDAVDRLVQVLRRDRARLVRISAAQALGDLGVKSPAVVESLVNAMRDDRWPLVQAHAAESLGRLGALEAVPSIRSQLAIERSDYVQVSLLEALVRLGDEDAFQPLLRMLVQTDDRFIQRVILTTLSDLLQDSKGQLIKPHMAGQIISVLDELLRKDPDLVADILPLRKLLQGLPGSLHEKR